MNLDIALAVASSAHKGQLDKAGQPYILHPVRLMMNFQNEDLQIVALLHDVVEDSDITLDDLRNKGFNECILSAIDYLTKRNAESYEDFIVRVSKNEIATIVKCADLKDNLDVTRINDTLSKKDLARILKYHKALLFLTSCY